MNAIIVDGKTLANRILADVRDNVSKLRRAPKLRMIVAGENPAIESFVRIKTLRAESVGIQVSLDRFSDDVSTKTLIESCEHGDEDALIVQLPLPAHVDTDTVLSAIPLEKDVDVLSPIAYARFESGEPEALVPPVALAVEAILSEYKISITGKRVVVVGEGRLVGKPVAEWFSHRSAFVEVVTLESGSLEKSLADAQIVVSGAGVPNLITREIIQGGAVLIDAGTSESGGVLVGDIDPACSEKATLLTPVPGGVGPVTVACLIKNTLFLTRQ
ncbi:Methenyltetrahydrofolate cyclohydrolase / Methylenetetrahydrofolate dehydrogenase (NADP+) [hydrothermal vent metagenome]|uniref:Methenyltetrahydrofolate cyclohydrolase / Methylenetetrahydrofolate dehydrogenase (NADP+) n=1 Tax=hydrothermal vent metagenome TaxID=652676 RepID=A0A3B0UPG8_9ZZZZ